VLSVATASGLSVVAALWVREQHRRHQRRKRQALLDSAAPKNGSKKPSDNRPVSFDVSATAPTLRGGPDSPLRERLTVILSTSPVGRHPSTQLIDEVIGSMLQLADGVSNCDMIIVCDGYRGADKDGVLYSEPRYRVGIVDAVSAANYEAYKAKLRGRAAAATSPSLKVLELESRHGFGFAVRAALEHVQTPYVLVVQHDRPFTRRCDVPRVLSAMEADPGRLKYVGLPTSTTVGHQYHVLSKYGIRIEAFEADAGGLKMLPLIQWYDSTHICQVAHYRSFVFGPRRLVSRGGFIEDKLGQAQLADIRAKGVEAGHPEYGTFLAAGDGFSEPCVAHLDGRDELNGSKFRFARGEALELSVQQQAEEMASRLVRSAKSGEPPLSVESAAARAAEAARIRVAETLQRQAELDRLAGKEPQRNSERERAGGKAPIPAVARDGAHGEVGALPLPKEAWKEYLVDNGQLKATTPGLGFRLSKQLEHRAGDDSSVEWGSTIMGVDMGDGWLQVHCGRYLPTHLKGVRVLVAADGRGHHEPASRPSASPPPRVSERAVLRPPPPRGPPQQVPGPAGERALAPAWTASAGNEAQRCGVSAGMSRGATSRPGSPPTGQLPGAHGGPRSTNPPQSWQYIDPKGNVQGPFGLVEMQHWNSKGYFPRDLLMRCSPTDRFVPLKELFPAPLAPFQSAPRRPEPG